LAEIKSEGAKPVCSRLFDDTATFDAICGAIERGEPIWLDVAASLKPGSDGASALSLNYSVARALPRSPSRVLALIGHGFSLEDICTSPFIEPEPGLAEDYEKRTLAALANVSEPNLKGVAADCAVKVRHPKA